MSWSWCLCFYGLLYFVAFFVLGFWCCRTRAGYSRADQYYASYPAGTELLTDTAKVYEKYDFRVSLCSFGCD
jgi:hypothetical protein